MQRFEISVRLSKVSDIRLIGEVRKSIPLHRNSSSIYCLDENLPAVVALDYVYVHHLVHLFLSWAYIQDLQMLPSVDI